MSIEYKPYVWTLFIYAFVKLYILCETMNGNMGPVHFYCTILSITFVHVYTEIWLKQCPYSPCTLNNHACTSSMGKGVYSGYFS